MPTTMGCAIDIGPSSADIGRSAAKSAHESLAGAPPKLALVFISPDHDYAKALEGIRAITGDTPLIGCSTAGEFSNTGPHSGAVGVSLIGSDDMEVRVGTAQGYTDNVADAVATATRQFVSDDESVTSRGLVGRTLMLLTDGLVGQAESVIDELLARLGMRYQLFGGAAADNAKFQQTHVFCGDQVLTNAFVCAEVLSQKSFGIGMSHGWRPAGPKMRVTGSEGARLGALNGNPAWEAWEDFAANGSHYITSGAENAFLMDHIVGIDSPDGHKLRVPLARQDDGSLICAAEVPEGSVVQIMEADRDAVISSGGRALDSARRQVGNDAEVAGALMFECVATRLRLGDGFGEEVAGMAKSLGETPMLGCNSYGQLARVRGEFTGLMDATALACLIPK